MALSISNFDHNSTGTKGVGGRVAYYTTSDTFATVEADGYFDSLASYKLVSGDYIRVYSSGSGETRMYRCTVSGSDVALGDPEGLIVRRVSATSAELKALNGTGITLIPAPGAGKYAIFEGATCFLNYGAATYDTQGTLTARSGTAISDTAVSLTLANTWLFATADAVSTLKPIATDAVYVANKPVILWCATANPATGDGTAVFEVKYRVTSFAT